MNNTTISIMQLCQSLKLSSLSQNYEFIIRDAEEKQIGYREFTSILLEYELGKREEKKLSNRLKEACLPLSHNLGLYDCNFNDGLKPMHLSQLKELAWLEL